MPFSHPWSLLGGREFELLFDVVVGSCLFPGSVSLYPGQAPARQAAHRHVETCRPHNQQSDESVGLRSTIYVGSSAFSPPDHGHVDLTVSADDLRLVPSQHPDSDSN